MYVQDPDAGLDGRLRKWNEVFPDIVPYSYDEGCLLAKGKSKEKIKLCRGVGKVRVAPAPVGGQGAIPPAGGGDHENGDHKGFGLFKQKAPEP
jgi:hypothetical protein